MREIKGLAKGFILLSLLAYTGAATALNLGVGFIQNKLPRPNEYAFEFAGDNKVLVKDNLDLVYGGADQGQLVEHFVDACDKCAFQPTKSGSVTDVSQFTPEQTATLQAFNELAAEEIWPRIDLELQASDGAIEKVFLLKPHANADLIKVSINGSLSINENNELISQINDKRYSSSAPVAWQLQNNQKIPVAISYKLASKNTYSFSIGNYDKSKPLWIDPVVRSLAYSGDSPTSVISIESNKETGDVYVLGKTSSTTFPAAQTNGLGTPTGQSQIYVAKFSSDLAKLKSIAFISQNSAYPTYAKKLIIDNKTNDVIILAHEQTSYIWILDESLKTPKFNFETDAAYVQINDISWSPASSTVFLVGKIDSSAASRTTFTPGTIQTIYAGDGKGSNSEAGIDDQDGIIYALTKDKDRSTDILYAFKAPIITLFGGTKFDEITSAIYSSARNSLYIAGRARSPSLANLATDNPDNSVVSFVAEINNTLTNVINFNHDNNSCDYKRIEETPSTIITVGSKDCNSKPYYSLQGYSKNLLAQKQAKANVTPSNIFADEKLHLEYNALAADVVFAAVGAPGALSAITHEKLCAAPGCAGSDIYIARFNENLNTLKHEIAFGGDKDESSVSVAISNNGDMLLATTSQSSELPGSPSTLGDLASSYSNISILNGISSASRLKANAFNFPNAVDVLPGKTVYSSEKVISGFDATQPLIVTGAEFSITGCKGKFNNEEVSPVLITENTKLCLKMVASSAFSSRKTATVTIGSGENIVKTAFSVTTLTADTSPDQFTLKAQTQNPIANTLVTSTQTSITGINAPTRIHVENGSYSIGCVETGYTAEDGNINSPGIICVRQTAGSPGKQNLTTLTVGNTSATMETVSYQETNSGGSGGGGGGALNFFTLSAISLALNRLRKMRHHSSSKRKQQKLLKFKA